MTEDRYKKGLEVFKRHLGDKADAYIERINKIYPKFAKINVEFPFGDLYSDTTILDDKTRELATVAALTVQGFSIPQLEVHVEMAINSGATKEEVLEIITQMLAYCGFPAATNALLAAGRVFESLEK
jgi:4-carboxymuconolactone decarboxylase